jgi:hypothetical protein
MGELMMSGNENGDSERPQPQVIAAHGAAALMLVESLMHFLIAKSTLTHGDALGVIEIASDALLEIKHDHGDDLAAEPPAATLLAAISRSLAIDGQ